MGILSTSLIVCITNGDLRAIPPMPITLSIWTPSLRIRSTMAFDPKAVASTNARNIRGAVLPRVRPVMVPFSNWLASGVLRPFIQSVASIVLSLEGIFSASLDSSGIILSQASCISFSFVSASISSEAPIMFFIGNSSTFLNQA